MPDRAPTRRRSGVPWWTPLLGLPLLAAGVAVASAVQPDRGQPTAAPQPTTQGVAGARKTVVAKPKASPLTAGARALLPVPTNTLALVGRRAAARRVPVLAVVGPDIFWVGLNRRDRVLVHLQGGGAKHRIRYGQRISFSGVVARTRARAAGAWGLTREEGAAQLARQRVHLEVFAPRIRFDCLTRCRRSAP